MTTKTLGTSATTSLVAVSFSQDPSVLLPADLATVDYGILDDQTTGHPHASISGIGGLVRQGKLFVPNRGSLTIYPGDYIAYDVTTGWPILVSAYAIASGPWTHS